MEGGWVAGGVTVMLPVIAEIRGCQPTPQPVPCLPPPTPHPRVPTHTKHWGTYPCPPSRGGGRGCFIFMLYQESSVDVCKWNA